MNIWILVLDGKYVTTYYGNAGCRFFKGGIQNQKEFWLKINSSQMKSLNFVNWCNWLSFHVAKNFLILYSSLENSTTGILMMFPSFSFNITMLCVNFWSFYTHRPCYWLWLKSSSCLFTHCIKFRPKCVDKPRCRYTWIFHKGQRAIK